MNDTDNTTHFGYQQVPVTEKQQKVRGVFDSVADKYDLMNDLMSGGIHRLWKFITIESSAVRPGAKVLDLAGGTGDLSLKFARLVGDKGQVILADINAEMLAIGRDRLIDAGFAHNTQAIQCNAECLPFAENSFDCITIAFGLRNVTHKDKALASMFRSLKPGGRLLILEFSKTRNPLLSKLYDAYSFSLLPKIGKLVTGDEESYRYLAESIRMHPDQETLKQMMLDAGFHSARYENMTGGVVALHTGIKA